MAALLYIANFGLRAHPISEFGFQQATWTDATSFWVTITTTQLLGVTTF